MISMLMISFTAAPYVYASCIDPAYQEVESFYHNYLVPETSAAEAGVDLNFVAYLPETGIKEGVGGVLIGVEDAKVPNLKNVSDKTKDELTKEIAKKKKQEANLTIEAAMDGRYIDIDISSQVLTLFDNRAVVGQYKVSTGKSSMPTPYGTFSILNKSPRAYSSKYGLYMPYWMAFTGAGHGIHELPEWPGGAKEGAGHLGIRVSHGCVRLGVGAAAAVYGWTPIGTTVFVHQ